MHPQSAVFNPSNSSSCEMISTGLASLTLGWMCRPAALSIANLTASMPYFLPAHFSDVHVSISPVIESASSDSGSGSIISLVSCKTLFRRAILFCKLSLLGIFFVFENNILSILDNTTWWGTFCDRNICSITRSLSLIPCSASTSTKARLSCFLFSRYLMISFPHSGLPPCPYPGMSSTTNRSLLSSDPSCPPIANAFIDRVRPGFELVYAALVLSRALSRDDLPTYNMAVSVYTQKCDNSCLLYLRITDSIQYNGKLNHKPSSTTRGFGLHLIVPRNKLRSCLQTPWNRIAM